MKVFSYGLSIVHQRGEADVFSMIFNPGDGGFLGTQFICHLFLGKACFKSSLFQENGQGDIVVVLFCGNIFNIPGTDGKAMLCSTCR